MYSENSHYPRMFKSRKSYLRSSGCSRINDLSTVYLLVIIGPKIRLHDCYDAYISCTSHLQRTWFGQMVSNVASTLSSLAVCLRNCGFQSRSFFEISFFLRWLWPIHFHFLRRIDSLEKDPWHWKCWNKLTIISKSFKPVISNKSMPYLRARLFVCWRGGTRNLGGHAASGGWKWYFDHDASQCAVHGRPASGGDSDLSQSCAGWYIKRISKIAFENLNRSQSAPFQRNVESWDRGILMCCGCEGDGADESLSKRERGRLTCWSRDHRIHVYILRIYIYMSRQSCTYAV